jgi:hypothetical protein
MRRFGLMLALSVVLFGSVGAADAQCIGAVDLPDEWFIQGDTQVLSTAAYAPQALSYRPVTSSIVDACGTRAVTNSVMYTDRYGVRDHGILDLRGPAGIHFGL